MLKIMSIIVSVVFFFLIIWSCGSIKNGEEITLQTKKDSVSYSIGMNIGTNMKSQQEDVDPDILVLGIKDVITGEKPKLTDEEAKKVMMAWQQEMMNKQKQDMSGKVEENQKLGETFLAENKTREGVVTTESGLQYKILKEGSGPSPAVTDKVTVHYHGMLIDGTVFDSSVDRGQPASFPVNGVIPGWVEALQLMKTGAKWKLFIPPALAYGERGAGNVIGPHATLIFDVELLSID